MRYSTLNEAIDREIVDAIEAGGADIASADEYDIDAIAAESLSTRSTSMSTTTRCSPRPATS